MKIVAITSIEINNTSGNPDVAKPSVVIASSIKNGIVITKPRKRILKCFRVRYFISLYTSIPGSNSNSRYTKTRPVQALFLGAPPSEQTWNSGLGKYYKNDRRNETG